MIKVKICGLRSADNALAIARAGADLIGLNLYPPSPRFVTPTQACDIARHLRAVLGDACPTLVGVFVNAPADEVRELVAGIGLDYAQLSGDETMETVVALRDIAFRAIRPARESDAKRELKALEDALPQDETAPSLLLDAYDPALYGGTGELASDSIARTIKQAVPRMMLAGGLNPENVGERARRIQPWGVDVASGVEAGTPGIKDLDLTRAFIHAARVGGA